nr:hypothetical protein [Tanacetum cinerariifolium]
MINVYKRNRVNGKIKSYGLLEFCKDGKDNIKGELAKMKKYNLEGKYKPIMLMGQNLLGHDSDLMASTMTNDDDNIISNGAIQPEVLQQLEQPQCSDLLKKDNMEGELAKSKKISWKASIQHGLVSWIDHNSINNFGSDDGVESSGSSKANVDNAYKPVMIMGQNLLCHESSSMASAMRKDDDNSLYDGTIEPEEVQQLEQPQIMDLLSCWNL